MRDLSKMSPYELGESGREEAVRYLILYLSKGTANEKRLAASAVKKLSSEFRDTCNKAVPFLIENLGDSHPQVRQYTLKALAKLKLPNTAHKIIKEISFKDGTEYNRRAALEILENVKFEAPEEAALTRTEPAAPILFNFQEINIQTSYSKQEEGFIEVLNRECAIGFTEKQKAAVLHKDGPALVLAVPGAGKTTVLLARTANLIINHGINPANILSITFSRASALDMRNRYYSIFRGITSIGANFSTIHSFSYELIRKYSQFHNISYTVIEDGNSTVSKRALLKKSFKAYNGEQIDEDALEELINNIGYVKNMMLSGKELEDYASGTEFNGFIEIYKDYEKVKQENNYLDYDDMLSLAYDILKEDSELLQRYRNLYRYIQIDEGQDTSKIQHKLIQLIASPQNNIFVVADDDQSIYSFRGAFPKFLLEFESMYPGTQKFYIEENFRSTREIVAVANRFIKTNSVRFDKNLFTNNESGIPVRVIDAKDEAEMVDILVKEINEETPSGDRAILYRNNMSAINLSDELSRRGVSFYLKDYNRFFFKHFVTEDIKAFMEFILDKSDLEAFSRIYYRMNSYISKEVIQLIKERHSQGIDVLASLESLADSSENMINNIRRLKKLFDTMKNRSVKGIILALENDLGYNRFLKDNAKMLGYSYESLRVILTNLKALAGRCRSIAAFLSRLEELEKIMEASKQRRGSAGVTLSTIHSSKGLEFSRVYIIDLFENVIPTRSSLEKLERGEEDSLEEERRLMYVAMTRARKQLNIILLDRKNDESVVPSRFVSELMSCL
jgi:DNA helicase II / ATP-dependent DNA helicase PcrA